MISPSDTRHPRSWSATGPGASNIQSHSNIHPSCGSCSPICWTFCFISFETDYSRFSRVLHLNQWFLVVNMLINQTSTYRNESFIESFIKRGASYDTSRWLFMFWLFLLLTIRVMQHIRPLCRWDKLFSFLGVVRPSCGLLEWQYGSLQCLCSLLHFLHQCLWNVSRRSDWLQKEAMYAHIT
jgi:hypothetical protein